MITYIIKGTFFFEEPNLENSIAKRASNGEVLGLMMSYKVFPAARE